MRVRGYRIGCVCIGRRTARVRSACGIGSGGMRLNHAIEGLARLDHAQFAPRALLDRCFARLEVLDLGAERIVALFKPGVFRALSRDRVLQCLRLAPAPFAKPEARLQHRQQQEQHQYRPPAARHVPDHGCAIVSDAGW